jgi:HD-GYP domain-containing protein (c-di-GMP phosphodiesterase class II)
MGLNGDVVESIRVAALIHDIGKINLPASILTRPGRLSEIEYDMVKTHPKLSYDMLKRIDFSWPIADIVLQHHERINGSGYPLGLKDKDIRLEAKILAVADVVEAMASHRPYRPALGIDKAIEEINKGKGKLYDRDVVNACNRVVKNKKFKFEVDLRPYL